MCFQSSHFFYWAISYLRSKLHARHAESNQALLAGHNLEDDGSPHSHSGTSAQCSLGAAEDACLAFLVGPFEDTPISRCWQAVVALRRLGFVAVYSLCRSAPLRCFLFIVGAVATLVTHGITSPFKSKVANMSETAFLFGLVVIGVCETCILFAETLAVQVSYLQAIQACVLLIPASATVLLLLIAVIFITIKLCCAICTVSLTVEPNAFEHNVVEITSDASTSDSEETPGHPPLQLSAVEHNVRKEVAGNASTSH